MTFKAVFRSVVGMKRSRFTQAEAPKYNSEPEYFYLTWIFPLNVLYLSYNLREMLGNIYIFIFRREVTSLYLPPSHKKTTKKQTHPICYIINFIVSTTETMSCFAIWVVLLEVATQIYSHPSRTCCNTPMSDAQGENDYHPSYCGCSCLLEIKIIFHGKKRGGENETYLTHITHPQKSLNMEIKWMSLRGFVQFCFWSPLQQWDCLF